MIADLVIAFGFSINIRFLHIINARSIIVVCKTFTILTVVFIGFWFSSECKENFGL